ncbi:MAG: NTP transferase domain-containing protein, partial [Lachnospiraceae bacterium]|nr:NTP transferase domain-containing protein [Lachnospiraceae bacterium]
MKVTALIMAGGRGERFWPRSRKDMPKQFLSLTNDGKTLIQLTVERILPVVDVKDIFISTNKNYLDLVKEQLTDIPKENIICEPVGRNTAPGIGLGAAYISKKYGEDTVMVVLPSDHLIKYNQMFITTLKDAIDVASDGDNLVTMGIAPDFPETGYGYIRFSPDDTYKRSYRVE